MLVWTLAVFQCDGKMLINLNPELEEWYLIPLCMTNQVPSQNGNSNLKYPEFSEVLYILGYPTAIVGCRAWWNGDLQGKLKKTWKNAAPNLTQRHVELDTHISARALSLDQNKQII